MLLPLLRGKARADRRLHAVFLWLISWLWFYRYKVSAVVQWAFWAAMCYSVTCVGISVSLFPSMDVVTLTERAPYLDRVVVVLSSGDLTNQNWVCFFVPAFHGFSVSDLMYRFRSAGLASMMYCKAPQAFRLAVCSQSSFLSYNSCHRSLGTTTIWPVRLCLNMNAAGPMGTIIVRILLGGTHASEALRV